MRGGEGERSFTATVNLRSNSSLHQGRIWRLSVQWRFHSPPRVCWAAISVTKWTGTHWLPGESVCVCVCVCVFMHLHAPRGRLRAKTLHSFLMLFREMKARPCPSFFYQAAHELVDLCEPAVLWGLNSRVPHKPHVSSPELFIFSHCQTPQELLNLHDMFNCTFLLHHLICSK